MKESEFATLVLTDKITAITFDGATMKLVFESGEIAYAHADSEWDTWDFESEHERIKEEQERMATPRKQIIVRYKNRFE